LVGHGASPARQLLSNHPRALHRHVDAAADGVWVEADGSLTATAAKGLTAPVQISNSTQPTRTIPRADARAGYPVLYDAQDIPHLQVRRGGRPKCRRTGYLQGAAIGLFPLEIFLRSRGARHGVSEWFGPRTGLFPGHPSSDKSFHETRDGKQAPSRARSLLKGDRSEPRRRCSDAIQRREIKRRTSLR